MKTIVAGSRDIDDIDIVRAAMAEAPWQITTVVSGTARGVDRFGEQIAEQNGIPVERYPADWDRYGKRAGNERNERMAVNSEALIAVWDGKTPGTRHMINFSTRLGLRFHVYRVFHDGLGWRKA